VSTLAPGYSLADAGRVLVLDEARERLAALGLDRFEEAMKAGELIRSTPHKAISRLERVFIKRYDFDRREVFIKAALKANFPVFSGPKELENALALRAAGLPVPRPLACGEEKTFSRARSFVVLEALPGEPLEKLSPPGSASERRALVRRVAALVRALHGAGFAHRDLYLANILVDGERLGLVDLERVVHRSDGPTARAVRKDLAALDYSALRWSRTDRLRFLRAYLSLDHLDATAKKLARRVRTKALSMARRGAKQ
jgi:heptose I phosphotransferase